MPARLLRVQRKGVVQVLLPLFATEALLCRGITQTLQQGWCTGQRQCTS